MGIRNLTFTDCVRVGSVVTGVLGSRKGPPLPQILEALAAQVQSNPASAAQIPRALAPELVQLARRVREEITRSYGDDYVTDLLARIRQ